MNLIDNIFILRNAKKVDSISDLTINYYSRQYLLGTQMKYPLFAIQIFIPGIDINPLSKI